ncbi:MAG: dimethylarginine dimethylaminohydrolase family protein [Candidatus Thorarchaeota archaeon]
MGLSLKRAIVRPPPSSFRGCISSHPLVGTLDLDLALRQHENYCHELEERGLDVIRLPPDASYPDSCFVEDTAVIHKSKALLTRMARPERRGEETSVHQVLKDYLSTKVVQAPATLEGGDVIHCEKFFISGESQRSNLAGIREMETWLGVEVRIVSDPRIVHLKSYMTYLGKNTMIVTPSYAKHPILERFDRIVIPEEEAYAANTLSLGDLVFMSSRHRRSIQLVESAGFDVLPVDLSEFEKCEGALTCLSLLF